eukprot:3935239-Rhodomonas_salina.1
MQGEERRLSSPWTRPSTSRPSSPPTSEGARRRGEELRGRREEGDLVVQHKASSQPVSPPAGVSLLFSPTARRLSRFIGALMTGTAASIRALFPSSHTAAAAPAAGGYTCLPRGSCCDLWERKALTQ